MRYFLALFAVLAALLAGCGQMGPLYEPDESTPPAAAPPEQAN